MGHVNNAAYLDYVDEQLGQSTFSRYRVEFLAPAGPEVDAARTSWPAIASSYADSRTPPRMRSRSSRPQDATLSDSPRPPKIAS
jgi:hypothetical protein